MRKEGKNEMKYRGDVIFKREEGDIWKNKEKIVYLWKRGENKEINKRWREILREKRGKYE